MFLVAPTDSAAVYFYAFAELDDVTAIFVHVTRIVDHACQSFIGSVTNGQPNVVLQIRVHNH